MTSNKIANWKDSLLVYRQRRVLILFFLGFSSGLPILLVFGSLSFWLREAGVDRSTIGFVSWVALAYGFKWVWSPLVDRLNLPFLTLQYGRRRAWLLLTQVLILLAILGMALTNPVESLTQIVWFALAVAFFSATQDIVIDAFRIETGDDDVQAAMASTYMIGYRIAMMVASAGVLWLAAWFDPDESIYHYESWKMAYQVMAGFMLVGMITTLFITEPKVPFNAAVKKQEQEAISKLHQMNLPFTGLIEWMWLAVLSPFIDFIRRYRWHAVLLLLLISTYRISDIVLGVVANIFYVDQGFTKAEVANVTKIFGVIMTLVGAVLGGTLVKRFGVMPILFLGALLSALTNLLFSVLAQSGNDIDMLIMVVSVDNLSAGIATAAFIAYLSSLTNIAYSATQYALFSSVMLLLPKFIGGYSGVMVDNLNYVNFFTLTAVMGIPVLFLIAIIWRIENKE